MKHDHWAKSNGYGYGYGNGYGNGNGNGYGYGYGYGNGYGNGNGNGNGNVNVNGCEWEGSDTVFMCVVLDDMDVEGVLPKDMIDAILTACIFGDDHVP